MIRDQIFQNIRDCMKHSRKNAMQVAKEMGVQHTQIYAYLNGTSLPSAEAIVKLCLVLDCSYEELLGVHDSSALVNIKRQQVERPKKAPQW